MLFVDWLDLDQEKKSIALSKLALESTGSRATEATQYSVRRYSDEQSINRALQTLVQSEPQSSRGRPRTSVNTWARQQIQQGRERSEVFADYLQMQQVDVEDEFEVEKARDRFRKAINRKESK